jgi:plasmid stabilization system protein ParE
MPAWTDKDERQYDAIKTSELDRGAPAAVATEIAARTVNKRRREQGRTPNQRTMGTGNPNQALEEHSRDELYNEARELRIKGRGQMTKAQLVDAIRHARGRG